MITASGAGLAMLPVYLWLVTDEPLFRSWWVVMPWIVAVALLMISNIATFNWSSFRLRREWRLLAIAGVGLLGAALVTAPWHTLIGVCAVYLGFIPASVVAYARVKRQRRAAPAD